MPSLRPNRKSSRTSSPAVRPVIDSSPAAPAESKKEKTQTLMDSWVEPPLKAPAPSFEDYGLERHSLFEQMAPLGSIPTDKLKLKLKFKSEVPRKPAVAKADGASATPELTPPLEQMATPKPVETSKPVTPARVDEKDKDYILNGSGAAGVAAPPKPAPKATTAAAAARNGTVSANHSPKKPVSGLMTVTDRGPPTTRNPELRKKYDVIVAAAVERSREQGQEILGQACRRIYEDSHYDQDIATLLDAVLNETASPQQRAAFAKTVKKAKKAIRAETGAKRAQSVGSNATSQRASSRTDKTTPAISNTTKATPPLPPPSPVGRISTPTTPATAFTIAVATAAPELRAARENPSASAHMNGEAPEPQLNTNGMGTRLRSRPSRSSAVSQLAEPISKQVSNNTTPVTNGRETRSGRRRASTSSLSSVDEEIVNEGPPPPSLGAGAKRTAADAGLSFEDEYNTARRRKLTADLDARRYDYERLSRTSDIRRSPPAPLLKSGITLNFTGGGRTTRSNLQRRARDGTDALESPMLSPNAQGLAPSGTHSRSGRSLGPPDRHVRKPRTGARTKISPIKDRSTVAGVPRNNGHGMNHPSRQGSPSRGNVSDDDTDDENSDQCTACGEAGELLCCDGCENAFHFKCCDPPLKLKAPILDEPYFCYSCTERSERAYDAPSKGIFGPLLDDLKSTNVQSFQLPRSVQQYFEGVICKDNGEYYDNSEPRVPIKPRNIGWEELGENVKNKEKDKLMRCKFCKESSITNRPIIQCDVCQNQWHLDCLDPPQANPPPVSANGKTRAFFRCPLHVAGDLRLIGNPAFAYKNPDGSAQRGHRLRRPRSPIVIVPTFQRGNKNNGNIVVYEDDEEEPIEQQDGVVYKLSTNTIKLDFISRVKQQRAEREARKYPMNSLSALTPKLRAEIQQFISDEVSRQVEVRVRQEMTAYHAKQAAADHDFLNRPIKEQSMAIFLTRFAQESSQSAVDKDNLAILARAIAAADPVDTVSTISVSDLQQLQGLITDAIKKSSEESNTNGQDFPDEPMMDVDNAADSDEESVIEPTRPILWTSRPEPDQEDIPRYMQDGPVESAPQQPTRPTISQQERSLSVPHETAKPTSKGRSKSVTLDSPRETRRGVSPRSKRLSP